MATFKKLCLRTCPQPTPQVGRETPCGRTGVQPHACPRDLQTLLWSAALFHHFEDWGQAGPPARTPPLRQREWGPACRGPHLRPQPGAHRGAAHRVGVAVRGAGKPPLCAVRHRGLRVADRAAGASGVQCRVNSEDSPWGGLGPQPPRQKIFWEIPSDGAVFWGPQVLGVQCQSGWVGTPFS